MEQKWATGRGQGGRSPGKQSTQGQGASAFSVLTPSWCGLGLEGGEGAAIPMAHPLSSHRIKGWILSRGLSERTFCVVIRDPRI